MADFKTHVTTSTVLGVAYGGISYFAFDVPLEHCVLGAGLCSVAGMLPDLDSSSGKPVREMLCFISAVVPMFMIHRFEALGMNSEMMVLTAGIVYIGIRFGVGEIFKRYTVHRGMWHSIPAAAIAGMLAFLFCMCEDLGMRLFKSWAVVIGFLSHLLLDELYSVDLNGKAIKVKKSFGTALKFYRNNTWANVSCYGKLALLCVLIASDAKVMHYFGKEPLDIPFSAQDWIQDAIGGDSRNEGHSHGTKLR